MTIREDKCWIWSGAKVTGKSGLKYGHFSYKNKNILAHRFSYEAFVGEIPKGLTIDNLCRNTLCVNPRHLEAVSLKENIRRGGNTQKTHCKRGHELISENLYKTTDGSRFCAVCVRLVRGSNKRPPIKHTKQQRDIWRENSRRYRERHKAGV